MVMVMVMVMNKHVLSIHNKIELLKEKITIIQGFPEPSFSMFIPKTYLVENVLIATWLIKRPPTHILNNISLIDSCNLKNR